MQESWIKKKKRGEEEKRYAESREKGLVGGLSHKPNSQDKHLRVWESKKEERRNPKPWVGRKGGSSVTNGEQMAGTDRQNDHKEARLGRNDN